MQYLLTEDEYRALVSRKQLETTQQKLKKVCINAALNQRGWCYLAPERSAVKSHLYCDDCLAIWECPGPRSYSK